MKNSRKYRVLFVKLSVFIGVILIGMLSLFYLHHQFNKPKVYYQIQILSTNREYVEDDSDDCGPLPVKDDEFAKVGVTDKDITALCKLVYGEGRGLNKTEMSAIVWCVLNRVDSKIFPNNIYDVCTQKGQFSGYKSHHPIWDNIQELVEDVIIRWSQEKSGIKNVGRTLPNTYLFFIGDGKHNHYMEKWKSGIYYEWSLKSPYEN